MGRMELVGQIEGRIFWLRGQRVMLDAELAVLYGASTKQINQAVRRNSARFPSDFVFRLTDDELTTLRSQSVTSNAGRGGRRYLPHAFTEHGAVMLSSVPHTSIAVNASIAIARAFVRLRQMVMANGKLAKRLRRLERKVTGQDARIQRVIDTIVELTDPVLKKPMKIGFESKF